MMVSNYEHSILYQAFVLSVSVIYLMSCYSAGIKKELAAVRKKVSASLKQALKRYIYLSGIYLTGYVCCRFRIGLI